MSIASALRERDERERVADRERAAQNVGEFGDIIRDAPTVKKGIGGKTSLTDFDAQALEEVARGRQVASADPLLQRIRPKAMKAVEGLDPSRFDALATESANARLAAGRRLAFDRGRADGARGDLKRSIAALPGVASAVDQRTRLAQSDVRRRAASALASARGGFNPAMQRAALMAGSDASARIGAEGVATRASEERAAALAALEANAALRGQDIVAQGANLEGARGVADMARQEASFVSTGDALEQSLINAAQAREAELSGRYAGVMAELRGHEAQQPGVADYIFGGAKAAGGLLAAGAQLSDERAKEDVQSADTDLEAFLDALDAERYRYKEETGEDPRERVGVMAQALEGSEVGARLVMEGEDGYKRVDYSPETAGPVILAALANLNRRLRAVGG